MDNQNQNPENQPVLNPQTNVPQGVQPQPTVAPTVISQQNPGTADINSLQPQAANAVVPPVAGQVVVSSHGQNATNPKSQTVAFVLAFCFGFFAWLYTYNYAEDKKKFWINFVLSLVTFGAWTVVAWIWAMIDVGSKKKEYYTFYPA